MNKTDQLINELKSAEKCCLKIIEFNKTGKTDYPVEYYRMRLSECLPLETLDIKDQNILWDLYLLKKDGYEVAVYHGFERTSMYKHIKRVVSKVA